MKLFEIGKKYECRSCCDHNCKWEFTVTGRTEKQITLDNGKRYGIKDDGFGIEIIFPLGRYSMAPILRAN